MDVELKIEYAQETLRHAAKKDHTVKKMPLMSYRSSSVSARSSVSQNSQTTALLRTVPSHMSIQVANVQRLNRQSYIDKIFGILNDMADEPIIENCPVYSEFEAKLKYVELSTINEDNLH